MNEMKMVTEAMKIAKLKKGDKQTDYDTLKALVAIYPEARNWPGHKLMNIIRTIKAQG